MSNFEITMIAEMFNIDRSEEYSINIISYVDAKYFIHNKTLGLVVEQVAKYYDEFNSFPSFDAVCIDIKKTNNLSKIQYDELDTNIKNINMAIKASFVNNYDIEWLTKRAQNFCREFASYNVMVRAIESYKDRSPGLADIPRDFEDALNITFKKPELFNLFDDPARAWIDNTDKSNIIPFKQDVLNKMTNNGCPYGKLITPSSGTNGGKTLFMVDWGNFLIRQGYNVLFITMEMLPQEIQQRQMANFMDEPMSIVENLSKSEFVDFANKTKESMSTCGEFIIEQGITNAVSAMTVKKIITEIRTQHDISFDVIMVDYLNTMIPNNGGQDDLYVKGKTIAMELKALAQSEELVICCPVQLTRGGQLSSNPSITDIAESHGISHNTDFLFALYATDDMKNDDRMGVIQLKSRLGCTSHNTSSIFGCRRSNMLTFNLDGAITDETNELDQLYNSNEILQNNQSFEDLIS